MNAAPFEFKLWTERGVPYEETRAFIYTRDDAECRFAVGIALSSTCDEMFEWLFSLADEYGSTLKVLDHYEEWCRTVILSARWWLKGNQATCVLEMYALCIEAYIRGLV